MNIIYWIKVKRNNCWITIFVYIIYIYKIKNFEEDWGIIICDINNENIITNNNKSLDEKEEFKYNSKFLNSWSYEIEYLVKLIVYLSI